MGEKLKVGVIGTGVLGRFHTKLYSENGKVELIGVYDSQRSAAEKVAQEFGTAVFESPDALADKCDALTIAVPATLHHAVAMPLIAKGKHILMEKPIASGIADAKEMTDAAEKAGIVFGVGHVERFNPAMLYLEQTGMKPVFIEAQRLAKYPPSRPGMTRRGTEVSVVLDLMIHDLDLVLTLIDSEVERFDAVGMPVLSGTEDIADVRLKFRNGAVAHLTASRVSPEPARKFLVYQSDSCASMDFSAKTGFLMRKGFFGVGKRVLNLDETNALADEINDFVSAVIASRQSGIVQETRIPGWQGLRALRLASAICDEIQNYNRTYGFPSGE